MKKQISVLSKFGKWSKREVVEMHGKRAIVRGTLAFDGRPMLLLVVKKPYGKRKVWCNDSHLEDKPISLEMFRNAINKREEQDKKYGWK